jgi:hypothetical protein
VSINRHKRSQKRFRHTGSAGRISFFRLTRDPAGSQMQRGRSDGRCGLSKADPSNPDAPQFSVSSPPECEELSVECPHDGAGLGAAQLGAAATGAGAGSATGTAGFGAARLAAAFFAGLFLALAFLADFFGAAAFDFLTDFLADFFAAFLAFFADFLADFFADFFFAVTSFFLPLLFLPPFFFLPLAILILLLPPINVYQAFQVVRLKRQGLRSVQSWDFQPRPGTACRPIEKLNRVHHGN